MEPTASYERSQNQNYRKIELNQGKPTLEFMDRNNYVSTCKYEWYTILPKNLFEQFHRVANMWFLLVSVLQLLPFQLSPTSSWATIAPLSVVLTFTLLKDAYQDYKRKLHDNEINNATLKRWNEDKRDFEKSKSMDLLVGNYVILHSGDQIPADMIILASSDEESACYVETSNLDGESNLKIKSAVHQTSKLLKHEEIHEFYDERFKTMQGYLKCENPNNRLYNFEGLLELKDLTDEIPIDNSNILLRGSSLKNTKWIIGVVIFVGLETKIMMNKHNPHHKRSNVEKRLNKYLVFVFSMLFMISIMGSIISITYSNTYPDSVEYFSGQDNKFAALNFITLLILYNSLVPISLYITMDLVKLFQSKFIQWDLKMYDSNTDRSAISKTGDLNEDLGQIEYIFSDKTGTLTENIMKFKKCAIKGRIYGASSDSCTSNSTINILQNFTFCDDSLLADSKGPFNRDIASFFEAMALCHTVCLKLSENEELDYIATSPDEHALVLAAHTFGYSFKGSKDGLCSIEVNGETTEYSIVGINEFSSDRKRMSIILKKMSDDKNTSGILLCKGADNVMLQRCLCNLSDEETYHKNLLEFASEGLRTLVFARRNLTHYELIDYENKLIIAKSEINGRTNKLEDLAEHFERDMEVLGITGIEDKIQSKVPETIHKLIRAGIKVWVLTGDKQETAINIGYSTNLLSAEMDLLTINVKSTDEAKFKLRQAISTHIYNLDIKEDDNFLKRIRYVSKASMETPVSISRSLKYVDDPFHEDLLNSPIDIENINLGLVIDGDSLNFILASTEAMKLFSILSFLCNAVICCRVSPQQKAEVVKLVKNHFDFKPVTLAIGDGANDVSMIQQAHVGIGIFGKEGLQAANSADYAIAKFSYLIPLLFLHGRWNYQRVSKVVLYSFYKNFLLVLPMFYYFFMNQYSGTSIYDSWLIMSYNTIFTALPIVVLGCMDKDIKGKLIISNPRLYTEGILSKILNMRAFVEWTAIALTNSAILYTLIVVNSMSIIDTQGSSEELICTGTVLFICIVQTATYTILLEMKDWNLIFCLVTILSSLLMYPLLIFYDFTGFPSSNMAGVASKVFTTTYYLFSMVFTPMICFIVHYAIKSIKCICLPSENQKIIDQMIRPKILKYIDTIAKYKISNPARLLEYANKLFKVFDSRRINKFEEEDLSFKKYTLRFNNAYLENSYQIYIVDRTIKFIRLLILLIFLGNLIWTLLDIILSMNSTDIIGFRITILASFGMILLYTRTEFYKNHYELSSYLIILMAFSAKFTIEMIKKNDASMSQAMGQIIGLVMLNLSTFKMLGINMVFNVLYFIRIGYLFSQNMPAVEFSIVFMEYFILLVGITVMSTLVGYSLERSRRREFVSIRELEYEYQKGRYLLDNLLPGFVQSRISQGIRYISNERMDVTIIYCEVCKFDSIFQNYTPYELIDLMDSIYSIIDSICDQLGVTRIETINQTYMICSGLKDIESNLSPEILARNHAERAIQVALEILKRLDGTVLNTGDKLSVRIGIHTGPVIAGVIGDHKPQFTLFGDTIGIAYSLCSNTVEHEKIRISGDTYLLVKHLNLHYIYDQIQLEGKPILDTFLIEDSSTNQKNIWNTSFESMDQHTYFLAQSNLREDLNSSALPLINKDSVYSMDTESKQLISFRTGWEDLEKYIEDVEDEYIGLAGPVQWLYCRLKETKSEHIYRIKWLECNMKCIRYGLIMSALLYSNVTIVMIIAYKLSSEFGSLTIIILRALFITTMMLLRLVFNKIYKHYTFPWILMMIFIITDLIITSSLYTCQDVYVHCVVLEKMYTNITISYLSGLPFGHIGICSIFQLMSYIVICVIERRDETMTLECSFFLFVTIGLNLYFSYSKENKDRQYHNLNILAKREITNTEKLLYQMIPPYAVKNLKNDLTITEKIYEMSILYADITGFQAWSEEKPPIEVVGLISTLFSKFDNLCIKHNVYKVHNIGDCYVITSLNECDEDGRHRSLGKECINMIDMSFDMLKAIKKLNRENKVSLDLRIGLHTGKVIGGITRSNIVRYDIYGPDVEITNLIQRSSHAGRINVSETTKALIEQYNPAKFEFIANQNIYHEPTGRTLESYFLKV